MLILYLFYGFAVLKLVTPEFLMLALNWELTFESLLDGFILILICILPLLLSLKDENDHWLPMLALLITAALFCTAFSLVTFYF